MVRDIVHDPVFLGQKSQPATIDDLQIGIDLIDTITANAERCVGMRRNMIGVLKNIIVFLDEEKGGYTLMYNPQIISCSGMYTTEEGCLSLSGVRSTKRYKKIKVSYQNEKLQTRIKTYTGYTAEIIQHEIDHCNGILI